MSKRLIKKNNAKNKATFRKKVKDRPYRCKKCGLTFTQERYLVFHNNKRPNCNIDFQCPRCNRKFKTKQNLKTHMESKTACVPYTDNIDMIDTNNDEEDDTKCNICGNNFATKYSLERHQKNCIKTIPPYFMKIVEEQAKDREMTRKIIQLMENHPNQQVINNTSNTTNNNNSKVLNQFNVAYFGVNKIDIKEALPLEKVEEFLLDTECDMIASSAKEIYANPKHPERYSLLPIANGEVWVCDEDEEDSTKKSWSKQSQENVTKLVTKQIKDRMFSQHSKPSGKNPIPAEGISGIITTDAQMDRINGIDKLNGDTIRERDNIIGVLNTVWEHKNCPNPADFNLKSD